MVSFEVVSIYCNTQQFVISFNKNIRSLDISSHGLLKLIKLSLMRLINSNLSSSSGLFFMLIFLREVPVLRLFTEGVQYYLCTLLFVL